MGRFISIVLALGAVGLLFAAVHRYVPDWLGPELSAVQTREARSRAQVALLELGGRVEAFLDAQRGLALRAAQRLTEGAAPSRVADETRDLSAPTADVTVLGADGAPVVSAGDEIEPDPVAQERLGAGQPATRVEPDGAITVWWPSRTGAVGVRSQPSLGEATVAHGAEAGWWVGDQAIVRSGRLPQIEEPGSSTLQVERPGPIADTTLRAEAAVEPLTILPFVQSGVILLAAAVGAIVFFATLLVPAGFARAEPRPTTAPASVSEVSSGPAASAESFAEPGSPPLPMPPSGRVGGHDERETDAERSGRHVPSPEPEDSSEPQGVLAEAADDEEPTSRAPGSPGFDPASAPGAFEPWASDPGPEVQRSSEPGASHGALASPEPPTEPEPMAGETAEERDEDTAPGRDALLSDSELDRGEVGPAWGAVVPPSLRTTPDEASSERWSSFDEALPSGLRDEDEPLQTIDPMHTVDPQTFAARNGPPAAGPSPWGTADAVLTGDPDAPSPEAREDEAWQPVSMDLGEPASGVAPTIPDAPTDPGAEAQPDPRPDPYASGPTTGNVGYRSASDLTAALRDAARVAQETRSAAPTERVNLPDARRPGSSPRERPTPPGAPARRPPSTPARAEPSPASASADVPEGIAPPTEPFDEVHYQAVFDAFVRARQRLEGPTPSLTFETFRRRLQTSEESLRKQHACRLVSFQVLIREDKVTLRPQLIR